MFRNATIAAAITLGAISASADTWHYSSVEHKGYEASGCQATPLLTLWDDVNQSGNYYKIENMSVGQMRETRKYTFGGAFSSSDQKTWRNEARSLEYVGRWEVCNGEHYESCSSFDSKVTKRENLPKSLDEQVSSVRLLGCYDNAGRFKPAEMPTSMNICITTKVPYYSGSQTVGIRAVDGDGQTMGNACDIALGPGEACCDTGYKGFSRPSKIEFEVKHTTPDAKLLQVTTVSYHPDPYFQANLGREQTAEIDGFAAIWLKDHTMCGMAWFGTCSAADAGLTDPKYDLFHSFAIGTDRACSEGYIEVGNSCSMNAGGGTRVVCKSTHGCANNQSR